MNEDWAAEVVGRLHRLNVTQKELAKRCDYTPSYLSMLLNGKKTFSSEYAKKVTRNHILRMVKRLEYEAEQRSREDNS